MTSRRILLNYPPVSSPWHLPVGVSTLTAMLREQGHRVTQRYGHIIGLEYVLRAMGGQKADDSLATIRDPHSDIRALYEARMTLERISGRLLPDDTRDEFVVLRNNVHYAGAGYEGTIESLVRCIQNRERSLWYDYFADVEIPLAMAFRPEVVGFGINDERQLVPGMILAAMVKEALPETEVVLGGNFWPRMEHAFVLPEFKQLFNFCDTIVYAEGFQPLTALASGSDASVVPGVVWYGGNVVYVNKKATTPTPFEELPTPHFNGGATILCPEEDNVLPLYTQSDCPHKCGFCAIPAGSDTNRADPKSRPRTMSAGRIAEHIKALAPVGKRFDFFDETFDINRQILVGKKLKENGVDGATWQSYLTITPDMVKPGRCKALYDAGCRAVQLGLESLSKKTLVQENKKWNAPEHYPAILRNLRDAGIQVHVFIMVGIPGEKITDTMRWLPFIADHGKPVTSWKPSRYRLPRLAPEERDEKLRSPLIEVAEDKRPLDLNLEFNYKNVGDPGRARKRKVRSGGVDSVLKDVGAALILLEEAERQSEKYALTSTLAWWPNRGRYSEEQLLAMAKELPPEPRAPGLRWALLRMERIVEAELGRKVTFERFENAVDFFRT